MRLGFLASHRGSNVESILDEIEKGKLDADPSVIISNNRDAHVLDLAIERSIPCYWIPGAEDKSSLAICDVFESYDVDFVLMAGYMKKLGNEVLDKYTVLNIHPSLLPKFGGKGMYGMRVHEAVIDSGDKESGATVHLADGEYDRGRILAQYKVPVFEKDTPSTLAERVKEVEHALYPQTLRDIQYGIIRL